jgi:hypothetical protein
MNFKKTWKGFWKPRFTTAQMEKARIKSSIKFEIVHLIYEDWEENLPCRAIGYVTTADGKVIDVNWNQYGECHYYGERRPAYDLIHPEQKEIDSAKPLFFALIGIIITVIFCI